MKYACVTDIATNLIIIDESLLMVFQHMLRITIGKNVDASEFSLLVII